VVTTELVLAASIRWLELTALAALVGGLVLELVVLPDGAPELGTARRRLVIWRRIALAVLIATSATELVIRAQTMTGGGLAGALAAMPRVLATTHFGLIWKARTVALAVLLLACFCPGWSARIAGLLAALGIALTTGLIGHAASWGDLTPTAIIDWLHVVASATWIGGLLFLTAIARREACVWPPALLGAVIARFSTLAGWCVLALVASGSYSVWVELGTPSAFWTTAYGRALALKLAFVLGLIWFGALNRYTVLPELTGVRGAGIGARLFALGRRARHGRVPGAAPPAAARLPAYLARETLVGLVILGCTAVLIQLTPPRHAGHERPGHVHEAVQAHDHGTPQEAASGRHGTDRRSAN
jgi:copper transport protein